MPPEFTRVELRRSASELPPAAALPPGACILRDPAVLATFGVHRQLGDLSGIGPHVVETIETTMRRYVAICARGAGPEAPTGPLTGHRADAIAVAISATWIYPDASEWDVVVDQALNCRLCWFFYTGSWGATEQKTVQAPCVLTCSGVDRIS